MFYCIFFAASPAIALTSNLRLVPLNPEASDGEKKEYALFAQGLEGRGSLEVTLLYPPGSSNNVEVVFDDSLQRDSGAAQANTTSPGSVRIGIIDANGFSDLSGDLAYISFDDLQKGEHPFRISGSAIVTDLDGKKVDSKIVIEQENDELAEEMEADKSPDTNSPTGNYGPGTGTKSRILNYPHSYSSTNNRSGQVVSQGKNEINAGLAKKDASDEINKAGNYQTHQNPDHASNREILSGIKGKSHNAPKGKVVEYKIAEDSEKSGVYAIVVDLPRGKFNFVLVNGEVIQLSEMDKKVNLKVLADNDCILYVFTDTILRIALNKHNKET